MEFWMYHTITNTLARHSIDDELVIARLAERYQGVRIYFEAALTTAPIVETQYQRVSDDGEVQLYDEEYRHRIKDDLQEGDIVYKVEYLAESIRTQVNMSELEAELQAEIDG